jgi:hypothetical protein
MQAFHKLFLLPSTNTSRVRSKVCSIGCSPWPCPGM